MKKKNSARPPIINSEDKRIQIIAYRWVITFIIVTTYFLASEYSGSLSIFLKAASIFIAYNIIITFFFVKRSKIRRKTTSFFAYIDTIFTSVFIALTGGAASDLFYLCIMIIAFHTVLNRKKNAIAICIFSIFSFSFSCIVEASQGLSDIYFYKMLIKDFLLIFASVGITSINQEVLKYNELHIKEFKMARTDKLTGLANRHYFEQKLIDEVNYSNRTGKPISVLIFDLDNFKRFNDTYGHVWGDKLLTLFSDIIKQNIRSTDIPVRYGGEEFLIILRDLDLVTARSVGERIRMQLEKQKIYIGEGEERRRATVSCGVAQYPKHSDNIKTVIDFADKALYKAKDSGKNIIVSYDEIENEQIDIESYLKT